LAVVSQVVTVELEERSNCSGADPPTVSPGDLVRLADGLPELVYCWPRGDWHLWIDELTARHSGRTGVVLDHPEMVDRWRNVVDSSFLDVVDLVVDPSWSNGCRPRVRVMFDDGWVGYVWLSALEVLESQ